MERFRIAVSLISGCCTTFARAQEKVAEGQYQIQGVTSSGTPATKTVSRWKAIAIGYELYRGDQKFRYYC